MEKEMGVIRLTETWKDHKRMLKSYGDVNVY